MPRLEIRSFRSEIQTDITSPSVRSIRPNHFDPRVDDPTLTLSRCPSANSRLTCASSPPAPSQVCIELFAPSSRVFALKNVPTISGIQDMFPYDRNPL